jgi:hypothetical protein
MQSSELQRKVRFVDKPDEACVFLALTLPSSHKPQTLAHWNGGRNHILWQPHLDTKNHKDWPGSLIFSPEFAIKIASHHIPSSYRNGFDIQTHILRHHFFDDNTTEAVTTHDPSTAASDRQVKFFFRGKFNAFSQRYSLHRWLAHFLHNPAKGYIVDMTCDGRGTYHPEYPYSLMYNSTFGYTPGCGGSHIYRLFEALAAGAIPVLTTPGHHYVPVAIG